MTPHSLRRPAISALVALLLASACHEPTAPSPQAEATAKAKGRWTAAGVHSYAFTAHRMCFCGPESVGPVRITVVNDQVASVVLTDTNQPVSADAWFDINGLFALVERELIGQPDLLETSFDPTSGYPTRVKYGDLAIDAGAEIAVTNFAPTPR